MRGFAIAGALAFAIAACGAPSGPEVPLDANGQPDAVLELGRTVWGAQCASCHGGEGQGGRGKKLNDGQIFELHPDIESQILVIVNGKGNGMPSFDDKLSPDETEAVARYVREVLN